MPANSRWDLIRRLRVNERTLKVPSKETDKRIEREYRKTRAPWKLAA